MEVPQSHQIQCSCAEPWFEIFIAFTLLQVDSVSLEDKVCNVNFNVLCSVYPKNGNDKFEDKIAVV